MVEDKKRFITVVIAILLFVALDFFLFFTQKYSYLQSWWETLPFNLNSKTILNLPPIIFGIILIFAVTLLITFYFGYKKRHHEKKVKTHYILLKQKHGKSSTDLDSLYDILKKNKTLKISLISKTFGIDKDTALAWAKILENNNLAETEYPLFSEPQIKLKA